MRDSHTAAPGAPTPGRPNKSIEECFDHNRRRPDLQERLRLFALAEDNGGVIAGRTIEGCDFSGFLKTARVGDGLQTLFLPAASRRIVVSRSALLAFHRVHSEADLSLVRGFDRFLAVVDLERLLEFHRTGLEGAQ